MSGAELDSWEDMEGRPSGLNLTAKCNSNITNLHMIQIYNYTYSIVSMVTLVLTAVILVATIFYKAYRTTLQRMVIYLTLTIMVYFCTSSLSIQLQPAIFKHTGDVLCQWTGCIQVCANTCSLVLSLEISLYLLFVMGRQARGKPIPTLTTPQMLFLELTCLFVGVVIPSCLWITKVEKFGVGGAICWLELYPNSNCSFTKELEILGLGLFVSYTIITSIDLLAYMVLVGVFFWLGCKFKQSRVQYMKTAKRTVILVALLVIFMFIQLGSMTVIYFMWKRRLHLRIGEIVFCIVTPISQLMRPLAYMFYLNSIKLFRWKVTKLTAGEWRESWRLCCLRLKHWVTGKKGMVLINNLDIRSSEYLTPSLVTSSHYESLGRTTT